MHNIHCVSIKKYTIIWVFQLYTVSFRSRMANFIYSIFNGFCKCGISSYLIFDTAALLGSLRILLLTIAVNTTVISSEIICWIRSLATAFCFGGSLESVFPTLRPKRSSAVVCSSDVHDVVERREVNAFTIVFSVSVSGLSASSLHTRRVFAVERTDSGVVDQLFVVSNAGSVFIGVSAGNVDGVIMLMELVHWSSSRRALKSADSLQPSPSSRSTLLDVLLPQYNNFTITPRLT